MRRGDGVDLLDDNLLEEFLDLGVGLLMLGPGHRKTAETAVTRDCGDTVRKLLTGCDLCVK